MSGIVVTVIKQILGNKPTRYTKRREFQIAERERELYDTDPLRRKIQFEKLLAENQRYSEEERNRLGPDRYAAEFVWALGGSIRPTSRHRWFNNMDSLTETQTQPREFHLEGINASETNLLYDGLDNFVGLKHLKHLDISRCHLIDDWCLNRLHKFKDTIESLDVSGCSQVSERGLVCLHHLKNLRVLVAQDMDHIDSSDYLKTLLEKMRPGLQVIGLTQHETSLTNNSGVY